MIFEVKNKELGRLKLIPINRDSKEDFRLWLEIFLNKNSKETLSLFKNINAQDKEQEIAIKSWYAVSDTYKDLTTYKIVNQNDVVIGFSCFVISSRNILQEPEVIETGFVTKQEFRNKNICTDCTGFLLKYINKQYPSIKFIMATCLKTNKASQRVLTKIGLGLDYSIEDNDIYVFVKDTKKRESKYDFLSLSLYKELHDKN